MQTEDFWLGTDKPNWLTKLDVPLFVSHRHLRNRRTLPRALGRWALDSGGFTELNLHGRWTESHEDYAAAVRRYAEEIGNLEWASPQDWMCEPFVLARTGYSVENHQMLTTHNLLDLRGHAPDLPWVPVIQGWTLGEYRRHVERYANCGVDLTAEPLVAIGSVCRRQATAEIEDIVGALAGDGLRLHGFGMKTGAFRTSAVVNLASADSLAWSYNARRNPPIPGHTHLHCSSCPEWALRWRDRALAVIAEPRQLRATFA